MLLADWIAIVVIALFCLIGIIVGFARGLRFFTKGFVGIIIIIIVVYLVGNPIYKITFVQEILGKLNTALTGKNSFCDILVTMRIDLIVYYLVLFIAVLIIKVIFVKIVLAIAEIESVVIKFIDKIFGVIFFAALMVLFVLVAFWIINLIGGSTAETVVSYISGSKLKLDWFYENNPFMIIIKIIRIEIPVEVPAAL